jgi:hypothetical protein
MADPVTEAPPAPKGKGSKKKILGLPVPVAVGAAAGLAALGYLWWRSKAKKPGSATTSASTSTTASSDLNAELAELQSEIDELMGQGSGSGGGGGGGGTSTITSTSTSTRSPVSTQPPTLTRAKNPVTGLRVTSTGYTSVSLQWDSSKGATDYLVSVRDRSNSGKLVTSQKTAGTSVRVGNLHRKKEYDFRVRAQPGGTGGRDASVTATTK